MSSKIVAAVPNSLLTQKSRSGSRSKSAKQHGISDQIKHSKSLAGNQGISTTVGVRGGGISEPHADDRLQLQAQTNSLIGGGRVGSLAMASISSHNLAINRSNELNRRVSQSPYSF